MMRRRFALWCAISLVFSATGFTPRERRTGPEGLQDPAQEARKTIPEIVRERGDVSMGGVSETRSIPDVVTLISMSRFVVRGRIGEISSHLTQDQMAIWTDFDVRVLVVLHNEVGTVVPDRLNVTLAGGKMKFPAGTAEMGTTDYPITSFPKEEEEFIFFLQPSLQTASKYQPVSGSQGAYRIAGNRIVPAAGPEHILFERYLGTDIGSFSAEVIVEAKRQKSRRMQE